MAECASTCQHDAHDQDSNISTGPSLKRCHTFSTEENFQEIFEMSQMMQSFDSKNVDGPDQSLKGRNQLGISVFNNDITSDQICPNAPSDRSGIKSSNSNNNGKKSKCEISVRRKVVNFPSQVISGLNDWYLYRINISDDCSLGFIVPCKLLKLPTFCLYINEEILKVKLTFLGEVNIQELKHQLERFCRYVFEEVFYEMNIGLQSNLKYDLEQSPFKLLPCLLTDSDQLDCQRMNSIYNRNDQSMNKQIKINEKEVYIRTDFTDKHRYVKIFNDYCSQQASGQYTKSGKVSVEPFVKPSIDYLQKSRPPTHKRQKTQQINVQQCKISCLRYAPLNQTDFILISKLPTILVRIVQLHRIEQLRRLIASINSNNLLADVDRLPIVTFHECLHQIISLNQTTISPLVCSDDKLLSTSSNNVRLSHDMLLQATNPSSVHEYTNMKIFATLGDCFLKMVVSIPIYFRYVSGSVTNPGKERDAAVQNSNLHTLAIEAGLEDYLYLTKDILNGDKANWLPPGYKIDDEHSDRYSTTQEIKPKSFGDMIEAIIGILLSAICDHEARKFMAWLGLDVIWKESDVPVPWIDAPNNFSNYSTEMHNIQMNLKYQFKNKAYLLAALMDKPLIKPKINKNQLKFIGNPLFEFLITKYIFSTGKVITAGQLSTIRSHFFKKKFKAEIMIANGLNIRTKYKITSSISIPKLNYDNEDDIEILYQSFEALLGAIFLDSGFSFEIVWNVLRHLIEQHIDLDLEIDKRIKDQLN